MFKSQRVVKKIIFSILFPFSILYDGITGLRNYLYDNQYKKVTKFDVPLINVGNLTVGGTGKTPHVEYLIRLLKSKFAITTLSRGYKRTTKGFLYAHSTANAQTLGDEPMQFYTKFGKEIKVSVGEKRVEAIKEILSKNSSQNRGKQLIILDDAFQHRPVKAGINLLISDYNRPFYKDYVLPSGRLRENRKGAKRADAVIVSKCPVDLSKKTQKEIQNQILPYLKKDTPIFFSYITYQNPTPCFDYQDSEIINKNSPNTILFTGIAKTAPLVEYVNKKFTLIKHFAFPDHYQYQLDDIKQIKRAFEEALPKETLLLCTEKDSVKLQQDDFKEELKNIPTFYLPICIEFFETEVNFDEWLSNQLAKE